MNAEQSPKIEDAQVDLIILLGKTDTTEESSERFLRSLCRGSGDSMHTRKAHATREAPWREARMINRTPVRDRPGALG